MDHKPYARKHKNSAGCNNKMSQLQKQQYKNIDSFISRINRNLAWWPAAPPSVHFYKHTLMSTDVHFAARSLHVLCVILTSSPNFSLQFHIISKFEISTLLCKWHKVRCEFYILTAWLMDFVALLSYCLYIIKKINKIPLWFYCQVAFIWIRKRTSYQTGKRDCVNTIH